MPPRKPDPSPALDAPAPTRNRHVLGAGPGRPRKPTAPRGEDQVALAAVCKTTEARLDLAQKAFAESSLVAVELELYLAHIGVAEAWAAYLRAQGNHSQGLKYGEEEVKFGRLVSGLRELLATDLLKQLQKRGRKEDALGGKR